MQQELMIERLFKFEFTRGVPARKTGVALLNRQCAYLPATTGVSQRSHGWRLGIHPGRGPGPATLQLRRIRTRHFGFLGVALIRSLVHNLGFTGLQELPRSKKRNTAVGYLDLLGRCLRLNRSSRQTYASEVADAFAVGGGGACVL
ncbi:hypothetical protein MTO96_039277 [Rhipicephalus appendiculatus]